MTAPTDTRTLEVAEAEYAALANKKSREAWVLREEIKKLGGTIKPQKRKPRSRKKAPAVTESVAPAAPAPVAVDYVPEVAAPPADRSTISPDLSTKGPTEKTALYWVGITPVVDDIDSETCERPPFTACTVAGITFPTAYTPWEGSNSTNPDHKRGHYPGGVVRLSVSQIEALKHALRRGIVRWRQRKGRHAHGYKIIFQDDETIAAARKKYGLTPEQVVTYAVKTKQERVWIDDEPLAKYLYCLKLDGVPGVHEGSSFRPTNDVPPSIFEVGKVESP